MSSVFSFHFYEPLLGPNDYFSERTLNAIRWNTTGFLTEFDILNENSTCATSTCVVDGLGVQALCRFPLCLFLNNGSANHFVRQALSLAFRVGV